MHLSNWLIWNLLIRPDCNTLAIKLWYTTDSNSLNDSVPVVCRYISAVFQMFLVRAFLNDWNGGGRTVTVKRNGTTVTFQHATRNRICGKVY